MPSFRYRGKDEEGKNIVGRIQAGSRQQALSELWGQGYVVLSFDECRAWAGNSELLKVLYGKKVSARDLMFFCRKMSALLSAGFPMAKALETLRQSGDSYILDNTLELVQRDIEGGSYLFRAMAEHPGVFPPVMVHMVEAGEAGGFLEKVFIRLAEHFEKEYDLWEKVRSATAYPCVILVVAIFVVSFLLIKVLPTFTNIFENMNVDLPLLTRAVTGIGVFLARYWLYIIVCSLLAGIILRFFVRKNMRYFDLMKIQLPVLGPVYQKVLLARFTRNMEMLLESGVGIITSLELLKNIVNNACYEDMLLQSQEEIRQGQSLAAVLEESGLFPVMVVKMISVGEESSSLDFMLGKTAEILESDIKYALERLNSLIEPLIIVLMAFLVGIIVLSVLIPMFQVFQHIG
ncbi:type II secretion system F family protein [Candidatus Contubernalis alkaliaceticus]|uniref:type II secretion system F family protein n=1 Tax=Candidatus Contubernalis alkaliaceticus TaxID=338645 RepID=UPI001F4BCFCC|nr:type II secretion system F family protein [Candidatus Contubernalis alkalaceticus]UNC92572.1 type II secretion system F family protein [Candidatus Contubernalis alkalaceticus]